MSLLDKQEIQDIYEHTALRAENGVDLYVNCGFICVRRYDTIALGLLKKEEEEGRRMPNHDFYFARCVYT